MLILALLTDKVSLSLPDDWTDLSCSSEPRCTCTQSDVGKYKADCSSLDLHEFPDFSENVNEITLFNNSFGSIFTNSCLPKGLTHLDISACKLNEIHRGFLRNFSRLEYLDLSHNKEITLRVLPNVTYDLQFTNIKILKFNAIQCKYGTGLTFKRAYTQYLKNTSIEEVHLSSNRIETVEQFVLSNIQASIKYIIAADNRLLFSWAVLETPYLEHLILADFSRQYTSSNSFLSHIENSCNDSKPPEQGEKHKVPNSYPLKHSTKTTKLQSCLSEYITVPPRGTANVYICLSKSLKTVLVHHSAIGIPEVPYNNHPLFDFRRIKELNSKGNMLAALRPDVMYGNASSSIDYSDNFISDIDTTWFRNANLSNFNLSGNYLNSYIKKDKSGKLLENQRFIQKISLARNKIDSIPKSIFKDTINLRELDLSDNELENIQFIGPTLKKITLLNLRGNYIHELSEQEMTVLDSVSDTLTIDLSENDILCTCDTLKFLKWMQSHSIGSRIVFRNLNSYKCTSQNSKKLCLSNLHVIIKTLEKQCSTYTGLIVGSVIVMSGVIFVLIGGIFYRYRWKLRYIYYMAKRGYKGNMQVRGLGHRKLFQFDAFISYADDDNVIFLRSLISEIEIDLKLCLHERDFTPGCDIAENIANAIRDSRKTVCMISNNYLSSHWCMYEFNMALMERIHARDDDSMLILVLLSNIDIQKAPMSMMEFIQSSTYIEFPDDPTYRSLFWSKLSDSLNS